MSLRSIPVDISRLTGFICVSAPEERVDPTTGEVRTDRETGQPTYVVGVVCKIVGSRAAYVLDVQLVGEPVGLVEGAPVKIVDLDARPWEVDGRSGVSYRASSITLDKPHTSPGPDSPASGRGAAKGAVA
jgi:hypothetical protein